MTKPFASLVEAPDALCKLGHLLAALHLGRTMTVLDFGAGPCWLSRFLTLLGCQTISLDVSTTALDLGRKLFNAWPVFRPVAEPRFLHFDGRRIDLPDGCVDRVVCFEALHHVPNVEQVLSELYRILKWGGLAGFAEPGEGHSQSPQSQAEMRNFDVLELDVVISDIWKVCQRVGFTRILFQPFVHPTMAITLEERDSIIKDSGALPRSLSTHVSRSIANWSVFVVGKGPLALDSRGVEGLACEIIPEVEAAESRADGDCIIKVHIRNTGAALWLAENVSLA